MSKYNDDLPNLITRLITEDPNILSESDEELRRLQRTFEADRDPQAGIRYGKARHRAGQINIDKEEKALLKGMFIELKDLKGEDPDWDFIYDIIIGEHKEISQPEELIAIIEDHYKKVLDNFRTYFAGGTRYRNNMTYRKALARVHSVKAVHLALQGKSFKHILRRAENVVYPRPAIQAVGRVFFGGAIERDKIINFIDRVRESNNLESSPIANRVKRLIKFLTSELWRARIPSIPMTVTPREARMDASNQLALIAALFPHLADEIMGIIQTHNNYRAKTRSSPIVDIDYFRERMREFQIDYWGG